MDVDETSRVNAEKHLPSNWIETGRKKGNRGADLRSLLNSVSAWDTSRSMTMSELEHIFVLDAIVPLQILREQPT